MEIISLNVWGGRMRNELKDFLVKYEDIDVFCLQEVYHEADGKDVIWKEPNHNTLNDIKEVLTEHTALFHPHWGNWWGLSLFIKKDVPIIKSGEEFVYMHNGYDAQSESLGNTAKNLQYIQTSHNGKPLTIINFHGLWNGKGKTDSEDRLEQSRKIVEFVKTLEGEVIFCGDFNLLPDTESIKIIEDTGLRNLIKEHKVTSTRTSFYTKPEKFADYAFVSNEIKVKDFQVLSDEVSDHAPLYLQIE